ncbi:MAG: copper homeostasis protein CutC [Paludibacteraceae bacterium]|nr:copper homeostasis protein CutC [Paludibacteraceae bacterium]
MNMYKFEICANSVESCVEAQRGGADRVELCAGMPEGGTTPSYGDVAVARRVLTTTKLHVIIRPRGGDFLYSDLEKEIMLEDVRMARRLGVDGVVFGALTAEGDVDMEFMRQLMEEAEGMSVTFHRAFDVCRNPREALEQIIELGCDRILTSGQMPKAEEGVELLRELVERAGERIVIMPGCGVNASNIAHIAKATGACEFHFSARSKRESDMIFRRSRVSMGGAVVIDEYSRDVTDVEIVKETIDRLQIADSR